MGFFHYHSQALNRRMDLFRLFVEASSTMLGRASPVSLSVSDLNVRFKGPISKKIGFDFLQSKRSSL